MFTGLYPHEHGTYKQTHDIESMPLLERLGEKGYLRYGVSANGFASAKYGFDDGFDEFYNTQGVTVFPEGLDVHGYARTVQQAEGEDVTAGNVGYRRLLRTIIKHDYPFRSAANVAAAGLSQLVSQYPTLSRIPHPRFNKYNEFSYDPAQNTKFLTNLFERAAGADRPFFAFTNYMDPHHPYAPPKRYQEKYCGRTFSYYELARLAEETHPWNFMSQLENGEPLSESTLDDVRNLYAGEVRTVDEHLGRLLNSLEHYGLRDDTLVIVTADHGENLGETNSMGETRMGHVCSASDHHLRVPLVVAHPDLNERDVQTPVSLKNLFGLVSEPESLLESHGRKLGAIEPDDGMAVSEVPATSTGQLEERYPSLQEMLRRHVAIVYTEEWKVVRGSNGDRYALMDGDLEPVGDAPTEAIERCEAHLEALEQVESSERELSDADVSQLEALGYL
jgi:arylsulfatase A-like enzyme